MTDYSQNGEANAILLAAPLRGRFLDIGAYDSVIYSNTRALWELGYSGVLVEPHPGHAAKLRRDYDGCPGITIMECAVGPTAGEALLQATRWMTSTLDRETYEKWVEHNATHRVPYRRKPIRVQVVPLSEILALHGPFDVVSIDAEGWSVPIFCTLLALADVLPSVICVEYDDRQEEVEEIAEHAGYEVLLVTHENLVLALP